VEAPRTAIAVVSDDRYLPAACCQLLSTSQHLPSTNAAELFLLCCDVRPEDIGHARHFFQSRNLQVAVHVANEIARCVKLVGTRWPRAAYLRLHFDKIFGVEYERLIYFDADTRVRAPLHSLLTADLRGRPVAAVHDFIYYLTGNIRRRRRDLFLAQGSPYLQSGVMVFDWPATIADGVLARACKFLEDYPERCQEAPDQDALNAVLEGKWTPLDPRWNLHETYLHFGGRHVPFIEHYTSVKPWSRRRPKAWDEAAAWYAAALAGTAWATFVEPQSIVDRVIAQLHYAKFRYSPRVRDLLASHAPMILDLLGVSRVRDEDRPLPWAPRSRAHIEIMTDALIAEAERPEQPITSPERVLGASAP
jgi:lipopolysaccharide biosynthesis glycosyltransferase